MLNTIILMYEAKKNSKERKVRLADKRSTVSDLMILLARHMKQNKKIKLLSGKHSVKTKSILSILL